MYRNICVLVEVSHSVFVQIAGTAGFPYPGRGAAIRSHGGTHLHGIHQLWPVPSFIHPDHHRERSRQEGLSKGIIISSVKTPGSCIVTGSVISVIIIIQMKAAQRLKSRNGKIYWELYDFLKYFFFSSFLKVSAKASRRTLNIVKQWIKP